MELEDTFKENLPSTFVIVPFEVPFSNTFTPIRGPPEISVTFPFTTKFTCALIPADKKITGKHKEYKKYC